MMKNCSPLLLELGAEDPGIFVTQSVHKQMAGFSQASQIHKKDSHIKGQDRYVPHKRLNNAFMLHASTSPFYPIFTTLDVNARMHQGKEGEYLWQRVVKMELNFVNWFCTIANISVPLFRHWYMARSGKTVNVRI